CSRDVMWCDVTMNGRGRMVIVALVHVLGRKRRPNGDVRCKQRHETNPDQTHRPAIIWCRRLTRSIIQPGWSGRGFFWRLERAERAEQQQVVRDLQAASDIERNID